MWRSIRKRNRESGRQILGLDSVKDQDSTKYQYRGDEEQQLIEAMFRFAPSFGDYHGVKGTVYMPVFTLSSTKKTREQRCARVNSVV